MLSNSGQKMYCRFRKDVECIGIVGGKKLCFLDETTEAQFRKRREIQYVFCPLFPEVEKVEFMVALTEKGFSISKRWKD